MTAPMRMINGSGVLAEFGSLAQRLTDPDHAARSTALLAERCDFDDDDAENYRANMLTLAGALQFATVIIVPDAIRVETERIGSMGVEPPAWADEQFRPPVAVYPHVYFANETQPVIADDGSVIATLIEVSTSTIGLTRFIDHDGVILAPTRRVGEIGEPAAAHAAYHVVMLEGLRRGILKLTGTHQHADEAEALRRLGFERIPILYFLSIVLRQEDA